MPNIQDLQPIFQDVFSNTDLRIDRDTNSSNLAGWDSFNQVNLTLALEEKFGVSFSTEEIAQLTSVGKIIESLEAKGAK